MMIRESHRADLEFIVDFQLKMAKETEDLELNPELVNKGVAAVYNDKSKGIYYVAEVDNKIVASLLTTYEWSDWRNGMVLWIQSIYVLPEYRGRGIYKNMYKFLRDKVEADPGLLGLRLYVEKNNSIAQQVYKKSGMDGEHYSMFEWFA
jgi:ribosomal protein S18 acetylase RimI-like enzyme